MKIYAAGLSGSVDEAGAGELIDDYRRKKIESIKPEKDRQRSIYAGLLLRYAYTDSGRTGEQWNNVLIAVNDNGKPYVRGEDSFFFSLSHSGEWVVCAVDSADIGCDIQKHEECNMKIAKRFFSSDEYSLLEALDGNERTEMFYKMWTSKESFVKYKGITLASAIGRYAYDNAGGIVYDRLGDGRCSVGIYECIDGYTLCVCSKAGKFPKNVEFVDLRAHYGI